jgi:cytochrome P450
VPLCILVGSFRLLFHPLRNYPGPLIARLTDAYGGFFAMRRRLHLVTYQNFQKYGPIVRQAPNRLVFNTVTALNDIYLDPRVTKGDAYRKSQINAKYPSMINAIDRDQHRRKRKIVGRALTDRSLRAFEPTIRAQIDIFLRLLLSSRGKVVDMTERCQRLGVDVIGHLAFGHPFDAQTDETFRFVPRIINTMSWRVNVYMQCPPLARLEKAMVLLGLRQIVKFGSLIKSMIQNRVAKAKDAHHDLYSMVADDVGKGPQGLYDGELWPEAILFVTAGN